MKKAAGLENIPLKFYKKANNCMFDFFCNLFNKRVKSGFFPTPLKQAKVIPIYKLGKHYLTNNYRPISLLSPTSKIFESLISKDYYCSILSERQVDFRINIHQPT